MTATAAATPLPAGPRPHPLAGNLREWGRDPLAFLSATAREYGDVVPLRFGPTRGLLLNRADYVEALLVTQGRAFRKPPAIRRMSAVLGNGLVASDGAFWLRQRRLAQPAFHRDRIAAYGEVMVARADRMLDRWADGEVRDVHRDMTALTLEIVARTLFGTDVADEVRTVGAATGALFDHFQGRLNTMLFFVPDALPTPGNRRMRKAVRQLEALIAKIVAERRASDEGRGDLLSMLLAARDDEGAPMTDRQLRDEVMTLLLAGHETTALALSWCWYLLAQDPAVEARLHAELDEVLDGRSPAASDLPKLRYAEAVVSEALRLYPPAWVIGREAVRDVELAPYCIRKGTAVVASPWLLHRDRRYFEDPDTFRPERWLDGLAKRLPRGAFVPFGAGPRMCIGAGFAMTEAVLLLARIAQRYRLRLGPGQVVEPQPAITLRPRNGIRMGVERRGLGSR